MPQWARASVLYFVYIAITALLLQRLAPSARLKACAAAAGGLLLAAFGSYAGAFWLQLAVLPPLTLLASYWSSGFLWVGPMDRVERFFVQSDRTLRVTEMAARTPGVLAELLELAYAGVYPLIPAAFAVHMLLGADPDPDRFWAVILVTDFICFGMLPWIQTRPPRMLEAGPPWTSRFRAFNVRLLGETSIGVNTVPSGHAAEALAAALLVSTAPVPVAAAFWVAAVAVTAGAVLGRYHFAVDAIAGWAIALAVWLAL
ncbi:MAG TPA: phosphatase PAP2 family protein [Vicinamibacterales bacterium]